MTRDELLGTWRLVSITRQPLDGGVEESVMGDAPQGFINYAPDGRMMIIAARSDRPKPAGETPDAAEAEALFRSMIAYAGRFHLEDGRVVHDIDLSWNERWSGTRQVRFVSFDGRYLRLTTAPSPDPYIGVASTRALVWEKL